MGKTVYEIVTEKILDMLNKGDIPWQKPWKGGLNRWPMNIVSKKRYRGINAFILSFTQQQRGYTSNKWLSFKQASALGGSIRKGEQSELVVFFTFKDVQDVKSGEEKKVPILRYYNVFNLCQTEGIEIPAEDLGAQEIDFNPIEEAEKIVSNMPKKPEVVFKEQRAYYSPALDLINMPKPGSFKGEAEFYSTLFHEMVHSTGHQSRLDRKFLEKKAAFGSEDYSREELIAEFGSAMLCGVAGIEGRVIENQSAYIQNWTKVIKDDSRALVVAANQAQKAADYILGMAPSEKEEGE